MADDGKPGTPNVDITIDGKEVQDGDIISWSVERQLGVPDMATVRLSNQNDVNSKKGSPSATIKITVGKDKQVVFEGVTMGANDASKGGASAAITVTGVSEMHKMLRKKGSKTYQDKTDKQILEEVCQRSGLSLEYKGPQITHKHVYQHNLNDLDFLRLRAERLGLHVWCEGKTVHVKEPDFSKTASEKLSVDKAGILRDFNPARAISAALKKVTVRAWDIEKKELIVGTAEAKGSKLGSKHASTIDGSMDEMCIVDQPVRSKEEADALAKGMLTNMNLNYFTGQATVAGTAKFKMGDVVEIEKDAQDKSNAANGKYYVAGITHRHVLDKNASNGYVTILNLQRDAEA